MAEQPPDDRQAEPATGTETCVGMPQVVQAYVGQAGALGHGVPRPLQILAGVVWIVTGDNVRAKPLQTVEHSEGRGVEYDCLSAALAIRQEEQAAFGIEMLPFQVENFP